MSKAAIEFDAKKHEYCVGGVVMPSVTQILQAEGFINYDGIPEAIREFAMARGTAVHEACEYWDQDDLNIDDLDEELEGYLEAWKSFKKDRRFSPTEIEKPVYQEDYRYAGKLDRLGTLDGDKAVVDIKTGKVQKWTGLQLAAYEYAETGFFGKLRRIAVELRSDGTYQPTEFEDDGDHGVFLSAVTLYHWKERNK